MSQDLNSSITSLGTWFMAWCLKNLKSVKKNVVVFSGKIIAAQRLKCKELTICLGKKILQEATITV